MVHDRCLGIHSWLVVSTPLENMKVNWDDYSQYMEKQKMFQTTNQVIYYDNYALINHGYPWVNGRSDLIPKVEVLYHIVGHILWEYPLAQA